MGEDERPHILIIDDTSDRLLMQAALEEAGYRVSVSPVLLTRSQLLASAAHVIVQSAQAAGPGGTGWQYLTMLRRDPAVIRIPVVLMTTSEEAAYDPQTISSLRRLKVQILLKPFHPDELRAAVAKGLEHRMRCNPR